MSETILPRGDLIDSVLKALGELKFDAAGKEGVWGAIAKMLVSIVLLIGAAFLYYKMKADGEALAKAKTELEQQKVDAALADVQKSVAAAEEQRKQLQAELDARMAVIAELEKQIADAQKVSDERKKQIATLSSWDDLNQYYRDHH